MFYSFTLRNTKLWPPKRRFIINEWRSFEQSRNKRGPTFKRINKNCLFFLGVFFKSFYILLRNEMTRSYVENRVVLVSFGFRNVNWGF